jgi:hypothetical protein
MKTKNKVDLIRFVGRAPDITGTLEEPAADDIPL